MLTDVRYLKFDGNENLINNFYDILFEWRGGKVIDVLKGYCELKGNAVNEEMRCFFASEFPQNDEEYFGEEGVAFYFDSPVVLDDCIVILTYKDFFKVVRERYENHIKNTQDSQNEIRELLACLRKNLKIDI